MIVFWLLAPVVVAAALGMIVVRKAVHAALCLAVVMISLAVMYAAQDAPFLFAVQIIVYTGAIMMLFLFVLMLVGIDSDDTGSETDAEPLPSQRFMAALAGLLFGGLAIVVIGQAAGTAVKGLDVANADGNVMGLSRLLFGKYVLAFEFTSALLITAVLGAMVLAHRERLTAREGQIEIAARRMKDYVTHGRHPGAAPTPGVLALHNSVDTPALLPDGTPLASSMPASLKAMAADEPEAIDD